MRDATQKQFTPFLVTNQLTGERFYFIHESQALIKAMHIEKKTKIYTTVSYEKGHTEELTK